MKKNKVGGIFLVLAIGVAALVIGIFMDSRLNGLVYGFAGGMLGAGLAQLKRFIYWSKPEHQEAYTARLEAEAIARKDERNRMLRDRARSYGFMAGIYGICGSMMVFSGLDSLKILEDGNVFVVYLGVLLILLFVVYYVSFHRLQKKY